MSPTDDLLTVAQVAEHLGVSVRTVKRWALNGSLPHAVKLPAQTGAYLFAREEVDRFITDCRIEKKGR